MTFGDPAGVRFATRLKSRLIPWQHFTGQGKLAALIATGASALLLGLLALAINLWRRVREA